ncbi:Hypothetical protein AA314_05535 [Archangium gephyra]|uniref:Uncharacterized protein n=1 Tax=Archangium gephyra TaxID=48 RepID=A0AAC8QAJ2_9BACT|nr:Hypothetical protein AA314_05535 [Archangium gephyra]
MPVHGPGIAQGFGRQDRGRCGRGHGSSQRNRLKRCPCGRRAIRL